MHIISHLKKGAMVSDFETLMGNVRKLRFSMNSDAGHLEGTLGQIKAEASALLNQLEKHYYSSKHKGTLPEPPASQQLQQLCDLALQTAGEEWEGGRGQGDGVGMGVGTAAATGGGRSGQN